MIVHYKTGAYEMSLSDEDDSGTFSTASPAQLRTERAADCISASLESAIAIARGFGDAWMVHKLEAVLEAHARPEDVAEIVCERCGCKIDHECVL